SLIPHCIFGTSMEFSVSGGVYYFFGMRLLASLMPNQLFLFTSCLITDLARFSGVRLLPGIKPRTTYEVSITSTVCHQRTHLRLTFILKYAI
uniref:Uncharacterized protein n=1 Tax=Trichobilharzia regenti TaxID=157069 RepID=A0AA85JKS4_TRIRE